MSFKPVSSLNGSSTEFEQVHLPDNKRATFGNLLLSPDFSLGVNSADSDNLTLSIGGTLGTNNIFTFGKTLGEVDHTLATLTSGGTDDYQQSWSATLNDSGASGGSDIFRQHKFVTTRTNVTGWDEVYLMDWLLDGNSVFRVEQPTVSSRGGKIVSASSGGTTVSFEAYEPVNGFPRGQFVVGDTSITNAGLEVVPSVDNRDVFLDLSTYADVTNASAKRLFFKTTASGSAGIYTGTSSAGDGGPLYVGTTQTVTNNVLKIDSIANWQKVSLTGTTVTSGGTDDSLLALTQTLNDSGAPSGSDVNRTLKINQVRTDVTGWDDNYHTAWQVGGTDQLTLTINSDNGAVFESNATLGGNKTAFAFNTINTSGFTNDSLFHVMENGSTAFRIDANFGVTTAGALFNVSSGTTDWTLQHNGSKGGIIISPAGGDYFKVTPGNSSSGVPGQALWVQSGAHTAITASTEAPTIDFDIDATQTWATGALSIQRFGIVRQPTIAFAGASTASAGITWEFAGSPISGTNATIETGVNVNFASHQSGANYAFNTAVWAVGISSGIGNVTERSAIKIPGFENVSLGNQTADLTNFYGMSIDSLTLESDTLTRTVTGNVASLHIESSPVASTNVTFSGTAYSILVEAGLSRFDGGIVTKVSTANTANPPTDAELDSAFGTPATVGAGFFAILNDNGAGSAVYHVSSDGSNWWYTTATKAV